MYRRRSITSQVMFPYPLPQHLQFLQRSNAKTRMARRVRFVGPECDMDLLGLGVGGQIEPFSHRGQYYCYCYCVRIQVWRIMEDFEGWDAR